MIQLSIDTARQEVTIDVDDEGAQVLRDAARDVNAKGPSKVLIGELGEPLLIVRHVDYRAGADA